MANSYPIIRTKIRTPRRPASLIRRQRLVDFIHGAIEHRLILLAAGAGYGKTSLLVDYAHDTDLPVCWYSLDAHDSHVPTFVEYLVASIRERFPGFGASLLQTLSMMDESETEVEPIVRLLVHEMEEQIHQYFVLILDDYHEILESEAVNALLDGLLLYLPEQCHIILATRGIPRRLTLSRLAARRQVVGQSTRELAFDLDEVHALLTALGLGDLDPLTVQQLFERSEGWVTGLILAAQVDLATTQQALSLSGASSGVFDFLAREVLEQQRPEIQSFALRSALCREMSAPLCDSLLGIDNSAQLLRELNERNLFTAALDNESNWYQYHQLFREFLLTTFEQQDPTEFRHLRIRLGELMAGRGNWPQAIDAFLTAGAYKDAARGLEIVAQEAFDGGDWDRLQTWIDQVPPGVLEDHPRLLLYRGKLHAERGELASAMTLFDGAEAAFVRRNDSVGAARVLTQKAVVERFRGHLDQAVQTCYQVLQSDVHDPISVTSARHNLGICLNMQGESARGIAELQEALAMAQLHADDTNAGYIAHDIGVAELNRGHLAAGRKSLHQALMFWRKVGNASALAISLQGLGIIHHYLGEYIEAENRLQESLAKALDAGDQRVAAYTVVSQGDLYRDIGRFAEASETYQRGLTLASASGTSHLAVYALASCGYAHRFMGEPAQARQLVVEALDSASAGMLAERGLGHLGLGVLAADAGSMAEGREHLQRSCDLFSQIDAKRDLGRALLHLALIEWRCGGEHVTDLLSRVSDLVRELGTHQFIVAETLPTGRDRSMLDLLAHSREMGVSALNVPAIVEDVHKLIPVQAQTPIVHVARSAAPVEFLGLNGGQVLKDGEVVQDWESMVARVMIFLFLSHPRGLRRDRAIDLLWPEYGASRGNSLFHSTLFRVRSALYKDIIIHQQGGVYRLNPDRLYRYDVDEFHRLARLGLGQEMSSSAETQTVAREGAIALYRRPFLDTCEYEWCVQIRRSVEDSLVELLIAQARHLALHGAPDDAEALYLRALGIDPYDERAHRGIMWSRSARGDRSGAMRQFQDCKQILAGEMGISPETETVNLYVALLEGISPVPPPR